MVLKSFIVELFDYFLKSAFSSHTLDKFITNAIHIVFVDMLNHFGNKVFQKY